MRYLLQHRAKPEFHNGTSQDDWSNLVNRTLDKCEADEWFAACTRDLSHLEFRILVEKKMNGDQGVHVRA